MAITFTCPSCSTKIRSADNTAGKKCKCPSCGHVVAIRLRQSSPTAPLHAQPRQPEPIPVRSSIRINCAGFPKPRSFLTTMLLTGGFFGFFMGLFVGLKGGPENGFLFGVLSGLVFGLIMAFFVSGKQFVVRFAIGRQEVINQIRQAFCELNQVELKESDPVFHFQPSRGGLFATTCIYVANNEAVVVGPRSYVNKFIQNLPSSCEIDPMARVIRERADSPSPGIQMFRKLLRTWWPVGAGLALLLGALVFVYSGSGSTTPYEAGYVYGRYEAQYGKEAAITKFAGTKYDLSSYRGGKDFFECSRGLEDGLKNRAKNPNAKMPK